MPLSVGTRPGPYQILAPIGAGGMGEVYRAKDTKLDREVAIKVLPASFAQDAARMARFEREAKVLASLNHPNIAQIYGIEDRAIVMELVEGATLADRLLHGAIPLEESLKIASQIADALEAAHEKGVVHRDLKPANVKVRDDGTVKVLDFGLATVVQSSAREPGDGANSPTLTMGATEAGVILGTAAYMAPEQARGQKVDKRADIWAFGVVLYEMLTGERLFKGATASDVLAQVLTKQPDLDRTPAQARRLLGRCSEKDPKQRLRDIGEARFLLDAPPATAPLQSRLGWVVAAGAVFAVIAAALAFVHFRETPALQPLTRFSMDLGPEAVTGPRITAAISLDGRRLAFVARGAGGKEQLATRLLDQANPTLLAGTENASDPFFSPDSQLIGFFSDGKMKKISVQGGAAITLCEAPNGRGASWGDDGSIIVTLNSAAEAAGTVLSRVPESGGTPQTLTKPRDVGEVSHRWPQILPGAKAVLFTAGTVIGDYDSGSIEVLSLKTGQVKVIARGGYFGRYVATSTRTGELVYVHQGTLFGVPFDPNRLEARGTPAPLLEDVAADPTTAGGQFDFSRNGTFVYVSGKQSALLWPLVWLDSTGKTEPLLAMPGAYYSPRLSPDGKRLAFSVSGRDIEVYDWERDSTTKLTFTGQQNKLPVWTPDGSHIVFSSQSLTGYSLLWIRSDGAREAQPLMESKNDLRPYSFSPDGKRLAFAQAAPQTGLDLWTAPLDLSDPEHPKAGKRNCFSARCSTIMNLLSLRMDGGSPIAPTQRPSPKCTCSRFQVRVANG
jgi:Tol biopolymer transport system component/predicted Ser/Thr protein kinase